MTPKFAAGSSTWAWSRPEAQHSPAMATIQHFMTDSFRECRENTGIAAKYQVKTDPGFGEERAGSVCERPRNFMLHRGQPSSERLLKMIAGHIKSGVMDTMETGARPKSTELLEWDRWFTDGTEYMSRHGADRPVR
jgi:hypothetical protein